MKLCLKLEKRNNHQLIKNVKFDKKKAQIDPLPWLLCPPPITDHQANRNRTYITQRSVQLVLTLPCIDKLAKGPGL